MHIVELFNDFLKAGRAKQLTSPFISPMARSHSKGHVQSMIPRHNTYINITSRLERVTCLERPITVHSEVPLRSGDSSTT
jgi:hypothetical protein